MATPIQKALSEVSKTKKVFYVQIPDSAPAGVLSAFADAMETFQVDAKEFPPPNSLLGLAKTISKMARSGYIITLEFQSNGSSG